MCGRYTQKYDGRKLVVRYKATNKNFTFSPPPEIAPTMSAPVVIEERGKIILKTMRWGWSVPWTKQPLFNAKSETIQEKPTFRSAFSSRRCLVPADGFFEWREERPVLRPARSERVEYRENEKAEAILGRPRKVKYRFGVRGEQIFSLAGLWTISKGTNGEDVEAFTILTCAPNNLVSQYHNRMPVILNHATESLWLDLTAPHDRADDYALKPYAAGSMEVREASDGI